MATIRREDIAQAIREIGASARQQQPAGPTDMVGMSLPNPFAEPVRLSRGKDPQTWTREERENWFLHRLGPRFSAGVKPPPRTGGFGFIASPNGPRYNPATGEWLPAPGNVVMD
jgi:hypothetical protein